MMLENISCIRCVDGIGKMVKNGFSAGGKQRYKCRICGITRLMDYSYSAYSFGINRKIIQLTKEGMGIRGTARFLNISTTTLLRRLLHIASSLKAPAIAKAKVYEVDELRTFIKRKDKLIWVVCAYERESRRIVCFATGRRTNKTLEVVLKSLRLAKASRICTDRLKNYGYLIKDTLHDTSRFATNHLERMHLNLRTHLKRLARRSICYSRSLALLNAVLKIYLWG
ncbi:IS1 family transposase [Pseudopedobacter beijingensis]|uniref:IS1 family transposase n=1 Tax=Pseudopedobacter beijingensis TaxID=1207056 RepID=A0ABW4IE74_9SPHI